MRLETQLSRFIEVHSQTRFVIAYSGGVDSLVLLHLMHRHLLNRHLGNVVAVHVNHQIHKDSERWAKHCAATCQSLDIPFTVHSIDIDLRPGESLEAKARELRYQCFERHLDQNTCLLTAHHLDDQAETLLLQLMRGSGPKGLASMPAHKAFRNAYLGRPLLEAKRADILSYAKRHQLSWVEDPSNSNTDYDRNYIRKKVLPLLQQRWPAATSLIARSARQCASTSRSLQNFTLDVLAEYAGTTPGTLSCTQLRRRNVDDINSIVRCWLQQRQIIMPSSRQLEKMLSDVILSSPEATPCVRWGAYEVRRYRDDIYIDLSLPLFLQEEASVTPTDTYLVPGAGEYYFKKSKGQGFSWPEAGSKKLQIRFRQGGESCQPLRRTHQHKLKKLLQEMAVPSWHRDRLPLLYDGDQMLAVADLLICEPFGVSENEIGYQLLKK